MITAIISFSLCSGLLLGMYHLLLKGKTLFTFNRYYLLFSLAFSLAVPFIVVKTNVAVINTIKPVEENIILLPADVQHQLARQAQVPAYDTATPPIRIIHQSTGYWQYGLWSLYAVVALLLLARFGYNLYKVNAAIKRGESLKYYGARLLLTKNAQTPHTFLRYIFLNREDYHNRTINAAILKHELTHAKELHSVDIILIELMQAICWFNPFVPFYRRAIELNHEFIADAAAIGRAADTSAYQYLLLNTVSHSAGLRITSQFNYLTIKKRLMMMNRSTNAAGAIVAKAATVPVFIGAFLLFCSGSEAFTLAPSANVKLVKTQTPGAIKDTTRKKNFPTSFIAESYPCTQAGVSANELKAYQQIVDKYAGGADGDFRRVPKISDNDKTKLETIFKKMSREQQMGQSLGFTYPGIPLAPQHPTQKDLDIWKNARISGVWIDGKKVDNAVLNNYKPSDFGLAIASKLMKTAINYKKYKYQIDLYTNAYYANLYKQEMAKQYTSMMYFRMKKRS